MGHGQLARTYNGELTVGNYKGNASYGYNVINGDTILNGPFRIKKTNLDDLLNKQDYAFHFSGAYQNNYPTGNWKFQFGEFQSSNESQVVDYQYRVVVNGTQEEAAGAMVQGKPDGNWVYSVHTIEDSEVSQVLFKSNINFDKGVPQKNFRIENDSLTLAGRFLRNGLAHDEWSLYASYGFGASENWVFNNGVLNRIDQETDGDTRAIGIYVDHSGQFATINLDSRFIKALEVYQFAKTKSAGPLGGKMQNLLAQNAGYYKKIDTILSELGESAFLPEFKVKVPYFPFSASDKALINEIRDNYKRAKEISTEFLEDTQLNILKLSNLDAAYHYEVIRHLSDNFLTPIGRLLTFQNDRVIEFARTESLIENVWSNSDRSPKFQVTVHTDTASTKIFELQANGAIDFSKNDLVTAKEIAASVHQSLVMIKDDLNQTLLNEQRQQEVIAIEEQLIAKRNLLQAYVDSTTTTSPASISKALNRLKAHTDTSLSEYSGLNGINEKLVAGKALKECYDELLVLAKNIADFPEQERVINEKYQDRIWNPFMANLMDEEVKKRITAAYRKILLPHFLEQAQDGFKCNKAHQLNTLIKATNQRMLELRVESTGKLERKLRKVTEPNIVFELFGLEPIKNEQQ